MTSTPVAHDVKLDEKALVDFALAYGGKCRDCADNHGVCPNSGLPCDGRRKAVEHVVRAILYGTRHGFLPPLSTGADVGLEPDPLGVEAAKAVTWNPETGTPVREALLKRASVKSGMLKMGEPIAFGSDAAIIDELSAALVEELTRAHAAEAALSALKSKLDEAVEALRPFAEAWDAWGDKPDDATTLNDNRGAAWLEGTLITFGDLRRARSALARLR